MLEEQVSGESEIEYVWSPVYVDAMILRDRDTDVNGTLDERLYATHDGNFNISALIDVNGNVVERYVYEPYGSVTIYNADWSQTRSSSDYDWQYLHQGGRYSFDIGLYHFRNRDLSPTLGRWNEPDPIGFGSGDANLYRYVKNQPIVLLDPSGLEPDFAPWRHEIPPEFERPLPQPLNGAAEFVMPPLERLRPHDAPLHELIPGWPRGPELPPPPAEILEMGFGRLVVRASRWVLRQIGRGGAAAAGVSAATAQRAQQYVREAQSQARIAGNPTALNWLRQVRQNLQESINRAAQLLNEQVIPRRHRSRSLEQLNDWRRELEAVEEAIRRLCE